MLSKRASRQHGARLDGARDLRKTVGPLRTQSCRRALHAGSMDASARAAEARCRCVCRVLPRRTCVRPRGDQRFPIFSLCAASVSTMGKRSLAETHEPRSCLIAQRSRRGTSAGPQKDVCALLDVFAATLDHRPERCQRLPQGRQDGITRTAQERWLLSAWLTPVARASVALARDTQRRGSHACRTSGCRAAPPGPAAPSPRPPAGPRARAPPGTTCTR